MYCKIVIVIFSENILCDNLKKKKKSECVLPPENVSFLFVFKDNSGFVNLKSSFASRVKPF